MQVTNRIREKAKSFIIVWTTANVFLRAITSFFRVPIVSNNNTSFSCLSNTFWGTITPIPQNLDAETSQLMKKERYFNCKGKGHTMLNCPEKTKIFAITNASLIDDIENIDQEKE